MYRFGSRAMKALAMSVLLIAMGTTAVVLTSASSGANTSTVGPTAACSLPPRVPIGGTPVRATSEPTPSAVIATVTSPDGQTQSLKTKCAWRITFGGHTVNPLTKSVAYFQATDAYMALGTNYPLGVHADGVNCTGTGDVLNGLGEAEPRQNLCKHTVIPTGDSQQLSALYKL